MSLCQKRLSRVDEPTVVGCVRVYQGIQWARKQHGDALTILHGPKSVQAVTTVSLNSPYNLVSLDLVVAVLTGRPPNHLRSFRLLLSSTSRQVTKYVL